MFAVDRPDRVRVVRDARLLVGRGELVGADRDSQPACPQTRALFVIAAAPGTWPVTPLVTRQWGVA